jgi:nicotinate-nucleotide pyrophosphorylase (carboxylating)
MILHPIQLEPIAQNALLEDLGQGCLTTDFHEAFQHRTATCHLVARVNGVLAGVEITNTLIQLMNKHSHTNKHLTDHELELHWYVHNGEAFEKGKTLAKLHGPVASVLKVERTLLNFLQHLSGIATQTRKFVDALYGTNVKISDTRKTTPGLRILEKKAVLDGGGSPHRYNLGSAAMLKDNHIAIIQQYLSSQQASAELNTGKAILDLRQRLPHTARLEVEVDRLEQIPAALEGQADIIMLDNFKPDAISQAVEMIRKKALIEVSGGITLANIKEYAQPGVYCISTSQITMAAPPLDLGLDAEGF